MPRYEFRCPKCSEETILKRSFAAMDDAVDCLHCGTAMERLFSLTNNLHIPLHFRMLRTGGAPAGGRITFEDIHGVSSERELARTMPDLEPYNRVMSRPGVGSAKEYDREPAIAEAVKEARVIADAIHGH